MGSVLGSSRRRPAHIGPEDGREVVAVKRELLELVLKGGYPQVKKYVEKMSSDAKQRQFNTPIFHESIAGSRCGTPLMVATQRNLIDIAKLLIEDPITDINCYSNYSREALLLACQLGHVEIAEMLLAKEDVEVNRGYPTPIVIACKNGHRRIVEMLMHHPKIIVEKKNYLLEQACIGGFYDLVELLLDIAQFDDTTRTLQAVCSHDSPDDREHVDVVKKLISLNGNPNSTQSGGRTCLESAAYRGKAEIMEYLLSLPDVYKVSDKLFYLACMGGSVQCVEMTLNLSPKYENPINQEEGFRAACFGRKLDVIRMLMDLGYPEEQVQEEQKEVVETARAGVRSKNARNV